MNGTHFKQGDGSTWNLDQSRDHTKANEIEKIDSVSTAVSHDAAGNLTKSPKPGDWNSSYTYVWDAWNRLMEVKSGSTSVAKFAYDGEHKRITAESGSTTRHFYYSQDWQVLEERVGTSSDPDRQYLWNPNTLDNLVLRDRDTNANGALDERFYGLNDGMNLTAIADTSGAVQERYSYTPFGVRTVMNSAFQERTGSDYDWTVGYKGYALDVASGLYPVRFRWLHPDLGRWMSRDPIGAMGGLNLYGFVGNDPVNLWDLLGLLECPGGWELHSKPSDEDDEITDWSEWAKTNIGPGAGPGPNVWRYQRERNVIKYTWEKAGTPSITSNCGEDWNFSVGVTLNRSRTFTIGGGAGGVSVSGSFGTSEGISGSGSTSVSGVVEGIKYEYRKFDLRLGAQLFEQIQHKGAFNELDSDQIFEESNNKGWGLWGRNKLFTSVGMMICKRCCGME